MFVVFVAVVVVSWLARHAKVVNREGVNVIVLVPLARRHRGTNITNVPLARRDRGTSIVNIPLARRHRSANIDEDGAVQCSQMLMIYRT